MKILAIQGSPRPDGNTQAVLNMVLAGAAKAGAETELVQISELEGLSGCIECYVCQQTPDQTGCGKDDAMRAVLDKAIAADAIILATPVFCRRPAWHLEMAIDRFFCMFKFSDSGEYKSLLEGCKMAAVITAGGPENNGAHLVSQSCQRIADLGKCKWLGAFVATKVKDSASLRADKDLCDRAHEFGQKLLA